MTFPSNRRRDLNHATVLFYYHVDFDFSICPVMKSRIWTQDSLPYFFLLNSGRDFVVKLSENVRFLVPDKTIRDANCFMHVKRCRIVEISE